MSETQTAVTPTDTTPTPSEGAPKTRKRRSPRRTRLFDDGQGDYRFYSIAGPNEKLPQGTLVPVADMGGFANTIEANKALRQSGDKLVGKHLILVRGVSIVKVEVETQPRVKIASKERRVVGE